MPGYATTTYVNGSTTPPISDANLNKTEAGVEAALGLDSLAAIRALGTPTSVQSVWARGHSACADGGDGVFDWDSTATDSDDDGCFLLPTAHVGAGRWVRRHTRPVTAQMFGAKGDDSTDDNTAVQAWAAYIVATQRESSGHGTYRITATIDLRDYFGKFRAEGMTRCRFKMMTDDTAILKLGKTAVGVALEHGADIGGFGLTYDNVQDNTKTSAVAVEFFYFHNSKFTNVEVQNAYDGFIAKSTPSDNIFYSNTLDNLKAKLCSNQYFAISSGSSVGNTGNHITNLYAAGDRSAVVATTCANVYLFERMSDGSIAQINAEWLACNRALSMNRCSPSVDGFHMEGLAARVNGGAFINMIGSVSDITMRMKTCNFSGGDPETAAAGAIASFALIQLEDDATTGAGSKVTLKGSNDDCTAAVTNTRLAISNDGWTEEQFLDVPQWNDEDDLWWDATNEKPITAFVTAPATPHMPILRQYNDVYFSPYARVDNTTGTVGAGAVIWDEVSDTNAVFDDTTGEFEAPVSGLYTLSFALQTANNAEIRFNNTAGAEQTAKRRIFYGNGTGVAGSASAYLIKGEQMFVYCYGATTGNANTEAQFTFLGR